MFDNYVEVQPTEYDIETSDIRRKSAVTSEKQQGTSPQVDTVTALINGYNVTFTVVSVTVTFGIKFVCSVTSLPLLKQSKMYLFKRKQGKL